MVLCSTKSEDDIYGMLFDIAIYLQAKKIVIDTYGYFIRKIEFYKDIEKNEPTFVFDTICKLPIGEYKLRTDPVRFEKEDDYDCDCNEVNDGY